MKFCLKWNNFCLNLNKADEISIRYIEDKGLVDFIKKYEEKRINLRIITKAFSEKELLKLAAIKKQYPSFNFAIAMDEPHGLLAYECKDREIPFYVATPCRDWETFNYLIKELGVSDINVSGPLAFELPKVKRFLERLDRKVQVRITPNFMESITSVCHPLQTFFVRPEDLELYEPYVDVVEFEGIEHQDTFFNIYAKEKAFIGKLNQLIYNFPLQINNIGLSRLFTERRINCGRECLAGGYCDRCFSMMRLAEKITPKLVEDLKKKVKKNNETN